MAWDEEADKDVCLYVKELEDTTQGGGSFKSGRMSLRAGKKKFRTTSHCLGAQAASWPISLIESDRNMLLCCNKLRT
jgi:hypothetical protein